MARLLDGAAAVMVRPMLSYGVTQDLQVSASLPLLVYSDTSVPPVRGWTRMPAVPDIELMLGWRFHRNGVGVGARWESTLWVALDVPTDAERTSIATAPGLFGSAVTGYASRSVYVWLGAAYRRYGSLGGTQVSRPGDSAMASLVVGYRPTAFRRDYPHPDWRLFLEVVGERIGTDLVDGERVEETGGLQVFLGPTVLGLYGSWGISGGPVFPIHQRWNGPQPADRVRFAVNLTFWW